MLRKFTLSIIAVACALSLFAQVPSGYYNAASGLTGTQLKAALHNIIDDHSEYPYSSSNTDVWDILKESDKDPNNPNNVILFYTGWSVDADQEYNGGSGWNREHVWAKSRGNFGTSQGAGTDAHHLRPTDISVNSARNNRWFDEADFEYIDGDGATGCFTSSAEWIWEPRPEVKGDVARMLFYMVVRYEGDAGEIDLELVDYIPADDDTQDPIHAKLSTLLDWHNADPVDAFEINRNDVVFSFQGNRNPFIDNPSWACDIWGGDCSGSGGGDGSGDGGDTGTASLENFNNFSEGGSYQSGTFVGQDGSTWSYSSCRGDISIDGSAPTLGKGRTPQAEVNSGLISGGIGTLKFDYMKAFSTPVDMEVYVNGIMVASITGGTQNVPVSSGDIAVNIDGDFSIQFVQNNSSSGQVTIDNIEWTPMGGDGGNNQPVVLLESYFETGWDQWIDGGGDCARYSGSRSSEGSYSIRLRDNSSTASSMTSPALDLSTYANATMEFEFYSYSMEFGENFFIKYSSNNGSSWTTLESFARGTDFENNGFYSVNIDLSNYGVALNAQSKFRIMCDASSNADQIYVDEVVITAYPNVSSGLFVDAVPTLKGSQKTFEIKEDKSAELDEDVVGINDTTYGFVSYPNPTADVLNVQAEEAGINKLQLLDLNGKVILHTEFTENTQLNLYELNAGIYILKVTNHYGAIRTERIVKN